VSVRRLADDSVQPKSFAFTAKNLSWARQTIKKYPKGKQASAVIPVLWRAQEQHEGWVSRAAMEEVGRMLEMPFIRVYEIATFYTMFQLAPVGKKAHVQVCGTTPCMLRGSEDLMAVCKRRIAEQPHTLSEDGDFSWEEVECLGACVNAPMIQIFSDTYEDLSPEAMEELLDKIAKGQKIKPGPQVDRIMSAPEGGLTSLSGEVAQAKTVAPKKTAAKKATSRAAVKTAKKATPARAKSVPAKKAAKTAPAKKAGPERLTKPKGKADDLKLISGVGPKLEQTLNKLGFWHYAQIGKWTKMDISIVDDQLSFKGRIERDDWVKQAKVLAKGGEAEYIKVFGKKPR
jgi:NADH-quinone oxidoreductase subunit E